MPETSSERFHRLTSHRLSQRQTESVTSLVRLDIVPQSEDQRPLSAKAYAGKLPRLDLPTRFTESIVPGSHILDRREPEPSRPGSLTRDILTLNDLARLLRFSAGLVREHRNASGETVRYRAAPSAGNLHPVEVYVHAMGINGLGDGTWYYHAETHSLVRIGGTVADSTLLILTAIPWRTQWKYRERGYRHIWWDAGAMLANLDLLAHATGLRLRVRMDFPDAAVAATVGADEAHELPLAVVELGVPVAMLRKPAQPPAAGDVGTLGPDFRLVREAHEAGRLESWGAVPAADGPTPPSGLRGAMPVLLEDQGLPVEDLIRQRITTRRFRSETVSSEAMNWTLAVAARSPCWDGGHVRVGFSVFVHDVAEHRCGCYRMIGDRTDLAFGGDKRLYAQVACLDQPAAAECGYLALLAVDMASYLRSRGERGYRALQAYAGIAAARLQLAAVCLGLGSTQLTVRDDFARYFSPPGMVPLIAVAVGVPARAPERLPSELCGRREGTAGVGVAHE